ncbi:MAG: HAMP domain-containing protein, partial [Anaerolineae bacterium]
MRRLWVQLSIVFSAVVVISGILYIVSLALVNRPDLSPPYPNPEVIALIRANRIPLIMTIVASTVGISTGILFSRVLTGPLDELTAAARDFGAGDMSRRVAVHGSQEIVELGETFNRMAADIQHAEALRRNLVADVAHELRTPRSVLQGNLRAILDDVYPLEKTEIARLYDQTRHLSRLVADLHDLASAEANSLTLYRQPVDLAALVENLT